MAELKNYVEGQAIEPMKPRVYTTIEEQAELNAYREFGNLSQLRVLCDNYHELLNELRSRPTEADIRNCAIDEFAERLKELVSHSFCLCWADIAQLAEQMKEE
jgi:hypothetical protein